MKRRGGVGCLQEAFLIGWFSQTCLGHRECEHPQINYVIDYCVSSFIYLLSSS